MCKCFFSLILGQFLPCLQLSIEFFKMSPEKQLVIHNFIILLSNSPPFSYSMSHSKVHCICNLLQNQDATRLSVQKTTRSLPSSEIWHGQHKILNNFWCFCCSGQQYSWQINNTVKYSNVFLKFVSTTSTYMLLESSYRYPWSVYTVSTWSHCVQTDKQKQFSLLFGMMKCQKYSCTECWQPPQIVQGLIPKQHLNNYIVKYKYRKRWWTTILSPKSLVWLSSSCINYIFFLHSNSSDSH